MSLEEQVEKHLDLDQDGDKTVPIPNLQIEPEQAQPNGSHIESRQLRSSSVSSNASSNGTPRRRTYHIAPVSVGTSANKRSPRPSISGVAFESPGRDPQQQASSGTSDEVASYMSQLALKEARVAELGEQIKSLQLELQAAEFDLQKFKRSGDKLAKHLRNPPRRSLAKASTTDLQRGIQESISRSPSPVRVPRERSQMKRVVGEIGTQFWSFVEDVRTAALGEDEEDQRRSRSSSKSQPQRDPDPNQYI